MPMNLGWISEYEYDKDIIPFRYDYHGLLQCLVQKSLGLDNDCEDMRLIIHGRPQVHPLPHH